MSPIVNLEDISKVLVINNLITNEVESGRVYGWPTFGYCGHIENLFFLEMGNVDAEEEVFTIAYMNVWTWIRNKYPNVNFSYSDWYLNPVCYIRSMYKYI